MQRVVCRKGLCRDAWFGGGMGEDRGMNRAVETGVWALQSFHVAFLLLHDWVPLGSLNDVQAVCAVGSGTPIPFSRRETESRQHRAPGPTPSNVGHAALIGGVLKNILDPSRDHHFD